MPDMTATAEPIYALLKDKKKWIWNKLEEDLLRKIKETISRREVLSPFETRSERKVRLTCEACEEGMGQFWNKNKRTDSSCQCFIDYLFSGYMSGTTRSLKKTLACVAAVGKLKKSIFWVEDYC